MSNILRAMSDGTPYNFIVKPYLSYDGSGVPVGGHAKAASQTEDVRGSCVFIYLIYTYINIHNSIRGKIFRAAHGIQYVTLKFISLPSVDDFVKVFLNLLEIVGRSPTHLTPLAKRLRSFSPIFKALR